MMIGGFAGTGMFLLNTTWINDRDSLWSSIGSGWWRCWFTSRTTMRWRRGTATWRPALAVSMEQPTPPSPASTPPRTGSHSVFSLRDDERQKAPSLTIAKEGAGSEIDLE